MTYNMKIADFALYSPFFILLPESGAFVKDAKDCLRVSINRSLFVLYQLTLHIWQFQTARAGSDRLGAIKPLDSSAWLDFGLARLTSRLEPSRWQHVAAKPQIVVVTGKGSRPCTNNYNCAHGTCLVRCKAQTQSRACHVQYVSLWETLSATTCPYRWQGCAPPLTQSFITTIIHLSSSLHEPLLFS